MWLNSEPGDTARILACVGIHGRKILGQKENENGRAARPGDGCRFPAGTRGAHSERHRNDRYLTCSCWPEFGSDYHSILVSSYSMHCEGTSLSTRPCLMVDNFCVFNNNESTLVFPYVSSMCFCMTEMIALWEKP